MKALPTIIVKVKALSEQEEDGTQRHKAGPTLADKAERDQDLQRRNKEQCRSRERDIDEGTNKKTDGQRTGHQ